MDRRQNALRTASSALIAVVALFALVTPTGGHAFARTDVSDDVQPVREFIHFVIAHAQGKDAGKAKQASADLAKFQSKGCPKIPPEQWAGLAVMNKPITQKYSFAPGCDVAGTVVVTQDSFPVDLNVRHLGKITRVHLIVTPEIGAEWAQGQIALKFYGKQGILYSKSSRLMTFDGDYEMDLGLSGEMEKNRGGSVHVTSYEGKTLNLSEPLVLH